MKRMLPTLLLFTPLTIHAAPQAGHDYFSIQLGSGKTAPDLQAKARQLAAQLPDIRVERRGELYVLRAGFWADAQQAEAALRRFPGSAGSFIRTATYRPELLVTTFTEARSASATTSSTVPASAVTPPIAIQQSILTTQRSEQGNLLLEHLDSHPQQASSVTTSHQAYAPARAKSVVQPAIDERPLWQQLQSGNLSGFSTQLQALQANHPQWQPSAPLMAEFDRRNTEQTIQKALETGNWPLLQNLSRQAPEQLGCAYPDRLVRSIQLAAQAGALDSAHEKIESGLDRCKDAEVRIGLLYDSMTWLSAEQADQLIAREAARPDHAPALVDLLYARDLQRLLQSRQAGNREAALTQATALATRIREQKDGNNAALLGWVYLDAARYAEASEWFEFAASNKPSNDARYGLALARFKAGEYAGATAILEDASLPAEARVQQLRAELAFAEAVAANRAATWNQSDAALARARTLGKEDLRAIDLLGGWNALGRKEGQRAETLFAAAYRAKPDTESAEGWLLALGQQARWSRMEELAAGDDPQLAQAARTQLATLLRDRKLFVAAAGPQTSNRLSLFASTGYAWKDGTAGEDRLDTSRIPLAGIEWHPAGTTGQTFQLSAMHVDLNAGQSTDPTRIGSASTAPVTSATQRVNGTEWYASWQKQGWATFDAGLGQTISHPLLTPGRQWHLGMSQALEGGGIWSARLRETPVMESLLSYAGMVDPATGKAWGQVSRQGVEVHMRQPLLDSPWAIQGGIALDRLRGTDVADNHALTVNVALPRNFAVEGFDYLSSGPRLRYQHYEQNLGHYTLGHGGYFSPEHDIATGWGWNMLTQEGQRSQWQADAELGLDWSRQASSPCNALTGQSTANCAPYAAKQNFGAYASGQLAYSKLFTPNLELGNRISVSISRESRELSVFLQLRYYLQPQSGIWSDHLLRNTQAGSFIRPQN